MPTLPLPHRYRIAAGLALALLWGSLMAQPMAVANVRYDLKDNAVLHASRGQVLLEREQYDEAIEEFKAAIRLNPYTSMSAALYNNLGLAYRQRKQYALAFVSFQHAIRIQPTYALYYRNLIETYAQAGQLTTVLAALQQRIQDTPEHAEAWFMLGLLYKEQGERKQAVESFSTFLKLEPESDLARAARSAF